MGRLFGTDGVRGLANREVTAELALSLAVAAAHVLRGGGDVGFDDGARPRAVVGRDPRASGEFLSAAVMAGLASAGVDVLDAGVLPTPAIAFLTATTGASFGVMLSASHNAMPDNGIKIFAKGGHKLADSVEDEIEAQLGQVWDRPTGAGVGRIRPYDDGLTVYVAHLERALPHPLGGLRIVFDAAQGAAYQAGPTAFRQAGANVEVIGGAPDGWNINDGYGSTHMTRLQHAVVRHGADLGIAVDGDADRCLAVDAQGRIVDGDQILSVLSMALRERGELKDDTVVATVMSNLGMLVGLRREGITVKQTSVGDRYVLEEMHAGGYSLGGEQSGHVILPEHSTTGDGVLTGLMLASRVAETGRTLAHLASVMTRMPQVLVNVRGVDKSRVEVDEHVQQALHEAKEHLGDRGRVLLRSSGTEPLVRVMVEADEAGRAQSVAEDLARAVRRHLSLEGPTP